MKVMYLCDQRACENCSPECRHTTDALHAANFKRSGGAVWEKETPLDGLQKEMEILKEEVEGLKNLQEWGIVP